METLALEEDWLYGKHFLKLPAVSAASVADAAEIKSTSSTITSIETKLIRSACLNNVVTSISVLNQYDLRREVCHMVSFTKPLKLWQGHLKKTMRDVNTSRDWLVEQMSDSFLGHQKAMLSQLSEPAALHACGYFEYRGLEGPDLEDQILLDDEMATFAGDIVLGLISKRQRRLYYMTNCYPKPVV